jgi:homopolymeric O-antigen transport system permease protein
MSGENRMARAPGPPLDSPIRQLWRGRLLLRALVSREIRGRYAGSSAGLVWALVGPIVQISILTVVFSVVLQVRFGSSPSAAPFPIVLAWGLFPWLGFQEGLVRATTALTDGGVLVKRMAFPAEIVVVQPILAAVFQECIALGLLLIAMPLLSVPIALTAPLCLLPLVVQVALTIGFGWILGVMHVYIRDTAQVVVAALQAWFYLTPIVYPVEAAPPGLRVLLSLNPMLGIVESFRALALGEPVAWGAFAWSALVAVLALWGGTLALGRARAEIADLV